MLCIIKEELLKDINLNEFKQYMLYDLKNKNNPQSSSNLIAITGENSVAAPIVIGDSQNIPRSKIHVKYTKMHSKYNEPEKINNHKNYADKLFWIFYKIINNLNDIDLENINLFKTMKDFKISSVEKLRLHKNILKSFKIQKIMVEDDLTNNEKISFKTFHALCILYLVNVIVIRDNNTYCIICTNNDEKAINLKNYKLLKISNVKMSQEFNNFDIELVNNNYSEEQLENILKTYYSIEHIDKPIKAFSSYNLSDLIDIANKLNISIHDDLGKKKKKQDLYENILQKLI